VGPGFYIQLAADAIRTLYSRQLHNWVEAKVVSPNFDCKD